MSCETLVNSKVVRRAVGSVNARQAHFDRPLGQPTKTIIFICVVNCTPTIRERERDVVAMFLILFSFSIYFEANGSSREHSSLMKYG